MGLAAGVCPLYIQELSPTRLRGRMVVLKYIFMFLFSVNNNDPYLKNQCPYDNLGGGNSLRHWCRFLPCQIGMAMDGRSRFDTRCNSIPFVIPAPRIS